MLKRILAGLIVVAVIAGDAVAGPSDDARAAYDHGDFATALRIWSPQAEQGDAAAQSALGFMYLNGKGVQQDYADAAKWYRKAAEQGKADPQYYLGLMYVHGEGMPQDNTEAAKWFRLAAEQGDASAQSSLGWVYYQGEGVPQDYVLAHMWLNLAAAGGDKNAVKARDLVAKLMTPDQIAEAQRMAREWKPVP
jgi:TPR repeat protein